MLIRVTEEHIRKGVNCDTAACPIALAMHDAGLSKVLVGGDMLQFKKGFFSKTRTVGTPDSASQFVDLFDDGVSVYPFEFEIHV